MCGIAGSVQRRGEPSPEVLQRQLQLLDHRGPDSSGGFARGRGAVGQTRLSIIDLVTGDPPITTPDGGIGVALNGEIYNFAALRRQLLRQGHVLRTSGDTEVLAHLAERSEPAELAGRLDGMFAFAIWDTTRDRLVLGRDRLGKKPLYWWCDGSTFVFASEIKAVLAHPHVTADLDPEAIPAYLHFGYVPTPRTFFSGVRSVPPGHVLTVDADMRPRLEPYWVPAVPGAGDTTRLDTTLDGAAAEVRRLLDQAVQARLVSDVPIGAFLSGGIDSSAIVGLMAAHVPVRTFTIGFEDHDGFDERPWAAKVARRFGTDHTEFVVHPQAVDLVERLVWHHDQPFGDSSAVPTFLLSELTRAEVTVALCGDGGDELFAGYERFFAGAAAHRARVLPSGVLAGARSLPGVPAKLDRFLRAAGRGLPDSYRDWVSYIADEDVEDLCPGGSPWAVEAYREEWEATAGAHVLDRLLLLNLRTYLVDDLLPKVDRTAMAVGLEVRAPFLDHRLVEYALRLPPATKMRGMDLKRVLKRAVADLLPEEILQRPKKGFGVPLARWFRDDLAAYVGSTLGQPDARVRAHLRGPAVDRLLQEHASGRLDRGHALWTLLTLEVFLRSRGW
jgi:asparagine synthase (glutamine-hydrolysing)